ncbi:MAG TPA: PQQ-dependent sugar dehydrogenase, partial [Acidimicrobiales bacterium]|nr:PQQ-dependent sugar dehydrogenase [Acidimicrobiales bacterium]
TTRAPATTVAPANACAVGRQTPPAGPIDAAFPTALAFAPDGRLFFTERAGTIKVVQDGATKVFGTVAASTVGERGLLGIAVSPSFATDRAVYTFHSARNGSTQEVVRWTDCAGEGRNPDVIVELPAGSTCCHKGGRLAFGADGKLYVTLGDEHTSTAAADTSDVRGKVLRYNPDGSIPADNPYGNAVWASGFRNPFGLAISPAGRVAVTVNGPTGDAGSPSTGFDILYTNVTRGFAGQWPSCYGYSRVIRGTCAGDEPDWSSEARAVVPTGAAFVNASGPAPYAGKLVFCTLNDGMKVLTDGSPHATVTNGDTNCRLDVTQGPDNALYVADTDAIHRIS